MNNNKYIENFKTIVIDNSVSNTWDDAKMEWEITDFTVAELANEECICGKQGIKDLNCIKNIHNSNELFPIGNECIKKFERSDFKDFVKESRAFSKLLLFVRDDTYIELKSPHFSRAVLKTLYDRGAFIASQYNDNNPYNDYQFLLNMFNKRKPPTEKQMGKIRAIIRNSIKPFLQEELFNRKVYETNSTKGKDDV